MISSQNRLASHAGSWYTENGNQLNMELDNYLSKAQKNLQDIKKVKAVIGPHAGFSYSGPTAAWSYQYLQPNKELKVFLLGPCHHIYMKGCGLSKLSKYDTPIGNIQIDTQTTQELFQKGKFEWTQKQDEEDEHSLEMHLPYIQKMLQNQPFKLIPIMVGNTNFKSEQEYGQLLAPYFDDENNVFCVSSDFCHWGSRFGYQHYQEQDGEIWQSIERLDKQGMSYIESHNAKDFDNYLKQYQNTICGRHPIAILLQIIAASKYSQQLKTQFVQYAQSSKVKRQNDSSVSYAAGVTYIPN